MLVEIGHFALVLALLVAAVQSVVPLIGASVRSRPLMDLAPPAALLQFGLVALAFATFMHAHIVSDFSVRNVFENSNTAKPMLYKVTGVWGSHEGSMMLWVFTLTLFGGLVAALGRLLPATLRSRTLAIQGLLGFGTLAFIIGTSNPFDRLFPVPVDGRDLNPLLQDPGLAFHPPFLYFGYVGFSITYSFAIAALIEGRVGAAWARWVRPWALTAWCGLTIGIAMGSWWAYYVLGWGGWWYWDPVENASFMPWLLGTALLHSAAVVEKRETLQRWTVLLAILMPGIIARVIGPVLAWRRGNLRAVLRRLAPALIGAVLAPIVVFAIDRAIAPAALAGIALAVWAMLGVLTDLADRSGLPKQPVGTVWRRARHLPRGTWGYAIAHF